MWWFCWAFFMMLLWSDLACFVFTLVLSTAYLIFVDLCKSWFLRTLVCSYLWYTFTTIPATFHLRFQLLKKLLSGWVVLLHFPVARFLWWLYWRLLKVQRLLLNWCQLWLTMRLARSLFALSLSLALFDLNFLLLIRILLEKIFEDEDTFSVLIFCFSCFVVAHGGHRFFNLSWRVQFDFLFNHLEFACKWINHHLFLGKFPSFLLRKLNTGAMLSCSPGIRTWSIPCIMDAF